jgi:hypothetical protein
LVRSVREECLDRLLVCDRGRAGTILRGYARHFSAHWPRQGRGQLAPFDDPDVIPLPAVRIERRQAIAGLINEYRRAGWGSTTPQLIAREGALKHYGVITREIAVADGPDPPPRSPAAGPRRPRQCALTGMMPVFDAYLNVSRCHAKLGASLLPDRLDAGGMIRLPPQPPTAFRGV